MATILLNLFLLNLLMLQGATSPLETVRTVVEGLSMDVDIRCNLEGQLYPLYWNIQGKVYDLYSVPAIFTVLGHEAISLRGVDRRMDGWRLYCFTTNEDGLNQGGVTVLNILHGGDAVNLIGTNDLLLSSIHGVVLHYQKLQVEPNTTTLSWFYSPDLTSCALSRYRVDVFSENMIRDALSQGNLTTLDRFYSIEKTVAINTHPLKDTAISFRISALQQGDLNCKTSAHFYSLHSNGTYQTDILHMQETVTLKIPASLRSDMSLQLIWSKNENTQCICPPVEQFISQCACNIENNENTVTMSDKDIIVSNITQGQRPLTLYLVSSVSSGCHGMCNEMTIAGVYRVVTPAFPVLPTITSDVDSFCFTIPNNPIDPEVYEVNLTDSTGSLTRLSGVYNTSRCLSITSDLYPDVCGPFQLSVAAMNSAVTELTIMSNNSMTPCNCFQEKGKFEVTSSSGYTSAEITLACHHPENKSDFIIHLAITDNSEIAQFVTISCNSMKVVNSLMSAKKYTITTPLSNGLMCPLNHFKTKQKGSSKLTPILAITVSIIIVTLILAVPVGVYCKWKLRKCKGGYTIKTATKEEKPENSAQFTVMGRVERSESAAQLISGRTEF